MATPPGASASGVTVATLASEVSAFGRGSSTLPSRTRRKSCSYSGKEAGKRCRGPPAQAEPGTVYGSMEHWPGVAARDLFAKQATLSRPRVRISHAPLVEDEAVRVRSPPGKRVGVARPWGSCPPSSALEGTHPAVHPASKAGGSQQWLWGSTPLPSSAGCNSAGRGGLPDKQVELGSIPG